MSFSGTVVSNKVCFNCRSPLPSGNARFCDVCGVPQDASGFYQVRAELQARVEALEKEKVELTNEVAQLQTLTVPLSTLINDVQTITRSVAEARKTLSERLREAKSKLETPQAEGPVVSESGKKVRVRKPRASSRAVQEALQSRTFVYAYEGTEKENWSTQLTNFAQQVGVPLVLSETSTSPDRIVFTVTGTRGNLLKLLDTLSNAGFVNLRSRLVATRRLIGEIESAMNTDRNSLEAINQMGWYKQRSLGEEKAQLESRLRENYAKYQAAQQTLRSIEYTLQSALNAPVGADSTGQ